MSKISEITLNVELDDENVPQKLSWKTTDHPDYHDFQEVKCFSLSMFDKTTKDTMKIDLWTNDAIHRKNIKYLSVLLKFVFHLF